MKGLLICIVILNLVLVWAFVLKGNVKFTFGASRQNVDAHLSAKAPDEEEKKETKTEAAQWLVPHSTINLSDLRQALNDVLPGMVKKEVAECLHEKEVEFDDTAKQKEEPFVPHKSFKPVDDIDKAFEDDRTEGPAEGQTPALPDDSDESVPDFNELDKSLKIISDKDATPEQRNGAINVAVSVADSNIIVALPDPLHTQLLDIFAEYNAQEIDAAEEEAKESEAKSAKDKSALRSKLKQPKKIPDKLEDFNPSDF